MNIYLAGCGQIGLRVGSLLAATGHSVTGLKRTPVSADFPLMSVDLADAQAVSSLPTNADCIIFTVTPDEFTDSGYQQVYDTILSNMVTCARAHINPPLFVLVSSTGVYGQNDGQWVDETSATEPDTFSGKWVLHGEKCIRDELPNTVSVRFSGIYGDSRTRLIHAACGDIPVQKSPAVWTNRVHENDCVSALAFIIERYRAEQPLDNMYVVSDDMPATRYDVHAYIRKALNMSEPQEAKDNISLKCNKRCDNSRFKDLGFEFEYPSYQQGYADIIKKR